MNIVTILKALSVIGIIAMAAMLIPGIKRFRATEEGARAWERGKKFTLYNCFVSFVANFLDTLGIGSYATTATLYKLRGSVEDQYIPGTLVSLMGMSVKAAFPIMMGGCAFMVPFGNGPVYIKKLRFDARATVITTFVGTAGVLVAYFLVKSLPLNILFWFVVAAVMFTACIFLRDARRADAEAVRAVPEEIPAGKKAM